MRKTGRWCLPLEKKYHGEGFIKNSRCKKLGKSGAREGTKVSNRTHGPHNGGGGEVGNKKVFVQRGCRRETRGGVEFRQEKVWVP